MRIINLSTEEELNPDSFKSRGIIILTSNISLRKKGVVVKIFGRVDEKGKVLDSVTLKVGGVHRIFPGTILSIDGVCYKVSGECGTLRVLKASKIEIRPESENLVVVNNGRYTVVIKGRNVLPGETRKFAFVGKLVLVIYQKNIFIYRGEIEFSKAG